MRPVQCDTGTAGAKGRKPPGRNWMPQTRPVASSFCVNSSSPMPETSPKSGAVPWRWKTMLTEGCGTTCEA